MVKHAYQLEDPDLIAVLDEALLAGALSMGDATRYLRARGGLTQSEFARSAGVATKVIKSLESGQGNPTLESLNRIAATVGLRIGFVENRPAVRLGGMGEHARRQARARRAGLSAIKRNRRTLKEQHAANALEGSDFKIDLPTIE